MPNEADRGGTDPAWVGSAALGVFAVIILALVVYQFMRGEALDNLSKWRKRSTDPANFWFFVLGEIVTALVLLGFAAPGIFAALANSN